ncbi:MAG: hypothetical protein EOO42_01435 [Flavobacteriales bacterium]|nr:MAG: hypothetical protein EOO42_01435 [Flavobacteriales bacterium]
MHIRFTQKHFKILSFLLLSTILFSCKKTEYIDYEKEVANRILTFKVSGLPQDIEPSIDQEEQMIRVYIPYYSSLDYIVAKVKLDEGALIFDEAGQQLDTDEDLEPVAVGDTTKYTVKSKDGIAKTYTVIHELLPFASELTAKFSDAVNTTSGLIEKRVHSLMTLTGNFESTSKNATFIFTDKNTGKEHRNFVSVNGVVPGNSTYTMTLNVLPTALAGDYDVKMIHQGRTANLAPVRLTYSVGIHGYFLSTTSYAPGDTVVFSAIGYGPYGDTQNGIYIGVERVYLKFNKQDLYQIPANFTDDFDKKAIDMKIVSQTRTEIKAIFPDAPAGIYGTLGDWSVFFPGKKVNGLGFYFDFNSETNWGKDLLLAAPSSTFTIKTK